MVHVKHFGFNVKEHKRILNSIHYAIAPVEVFQPLSFGAQDENDAQAPRLGWLASL